MKLSKVYITAVAFLLVGVIVFFVGFAMLGFDFTNFDTEPVYTPVKYSESGNLEGIVIKDSDADIKFTLSEDKKVHIKYYENGIRTYNITMLDNDVLSVEQHSTADWTEALRLSRSTPVITVMLPKNFKGAVKVECENGDIEFDSITADGISAVSKNGDVRVIGSKINGILIATTEEGNIELYNNDIKNAAQLSSTKGNVLAQLVTAKELYAEVRSGYMTLADVKSLGDIFGEVNGGDIRLSALSAKYGITLITKKGDIRGSILGSAEDFSYNCNAEGGTCNLPEKQPGGEHNLNLRTQKGDIEVSIAKE
ncbi:MAG: DUF4097 family beta strand repeat protein [Clostridia bacterium]|nr:DUF4097 family beta strand repeat protein [Clostridia bacterium]